ncbi:MAG: TIGR04255 family protein [Alphaproteobacteria bacterium]|nr:TIGR04255 family protein [Alphaproteobacteria bacterium]
MPNPDNYEKVCYAKPFLKEVIARVDFPEPVAMLSKALPAKFSKSILSRFPISEPQQVQAQELQFSATGAISTNTREEKHWTYYGKEREKTLTLAPQHVVQTSRAYTTFEAFTDDFLEVIEAISKIDSELAANRVGLRYINVIEIDSGDPLEWSDYIDGAMLGNINLNNQKSNISRAFNVLEYNYGNINLKYQFGVANPDYPAIVRRKQFILDLDAFAVGAYELSEIKNVVNNSHALIQDFFEASLKEKARKLMGRKKNERKPK